LEELNVSVNMSDDQSKNGEVRLKAMMEIPNMKGFWWGLGTAVAVSFLWPRMRGKLRPVFVNTMTEMVSLADQAMESAVKLKEEVEDVLAEAKERARNPAPEDPKEDPGSNANMSELRTSVSELQGQIGEMRELKQEMQELKQMLRQVASQKEAEK
jgi:hypothetical protein